MIKDILTNAQVLFISSHKITMEIFRKKKKRIDFFILFRTYLNSDFWRFLGVETEVTIVDSCWGFCSIFNVSIDFAGRAFKLLSRTIITRGDDESTRCKYVVFIVSIGFIFDKVMSNLSYSKSDVLRDRQLNGSVHYFLFFFLFFAK